MTSIKVHCLVSCFCEIIKRRGDIDFRPFYFGLWDGDFDITEGGIISYHPKTLTMIIIYFGMKNCMVLK